MSEGRYCGGKLPQKGKLPDDIPAKPMRTYMGKGWVSIGDWLGTERVATQIRRYLPLQEARDFVHRLGIRSQKEWRNYCKGFLPEKGQLPENIPANPWLVYKKVDGRALEIGWVLNRWQLISKSTDLT